MPQVSRFLRTWTDANGRAGYAWWCPGCKHAHSVATDGGPGPVWQFDGNLEAPTLAPSFREFIPAREAREDWPAIPERTLCHCFVKAGQIEFLGDSTEHELRGFVPMIDLATIVDYGWGYE